MAPPRHLQLLIAAMGALAPMAAMDMAAAQSTNHGAQKAMFATKAEAEAAAKHFNCKGAHRMGNQWMPCASHGEASGSSSSTAPH